VSRKLAVLAAVALSAVAGLTVRQASASSSSPASSKMLVGIFDEAHTLYGDITHNMPLLRKLHVQVLRVNLYWGGKFGVAKRRPFDATDPADPAYDWSLYDRLADYAAANGIQVLFSIYGTPSWENRAGLNHAPKDPLDLAKFAFAAATRYSGDYPDANGDPIGGVHRWLAWNEPNNPVFLSPQYRRVKGRWVVQSAVDYAAICAAVNRGIHSTFYPGEQVACGGTAPRGNNAPRTSRPSVSPVAFLDALKKAGLKATDFDVYAHHPYYGKPSESPTTPPPGPHGKSTAVTMGNLGVLIQELTRLYGNKHLWITEYGYQTNPPDPVFGVSWKTQARYLTQSFSIARRNPRIDLMLWYLLQDEPRLSGWQSGLLTATGKKKPSFAAFAALR
jgi:hypothetical protein